MTVAPNDYLLEIPGHPDCVGMETGSGEWLAVRQVTATEAILVGHYPCEMPLEEVARHVTAWKRGRTLAAESDGDYDDFMALSVKGW